jgi:hypothetical protein
LSKCAIGLNEPSGVEIALSWFAIQDSNDGRVQLVLNIHEHLVVVTLKPAAYPHRCTTAATS